MTRTTDPDRGTGVLTTNQREYLLGESDVESGSNAERMLRSRIRDRIRNAILDFSLLATELRDDDRDQIFDPDSGYLSDFSRGLADLFAFVYTGTENQSKFETLLETGITWAELRQTSTEQTSQINVDITVEINRSMEFDMKEIADHVERGEFDKIPPAAALSFLQAADALQELTKGIQKMEEENTKFDETFELMSELDDDQLSTEIDEALESTAEVDEDHEMKNGNASDESGS